jgi:outer membrane receptor protein involved in Fe transport
MGMEKLLRRKKQVKKTMRMKIVRMNSIIKLGLVITLLFTANNIARAQLSNVSVSGEVKELKSSEPLPFVNVILNSLKDTTFITGTITNDEGLFTISNVKPGEYLLAFTFVGYLPEYQKIFVGSQSQFLNIGVISLKEDIQTLGDVIVTGVQDAVSAKLDKKTYSLAENISQSGGSVLQSLQNLPGITVQEGKIQLRGNNNVAILIDGKQTALTGFGSQTGLDNLPASSIEKIEIINNPSSKYDANGNAGIINIIFKKENQEGFNGKIGFTAGLGALWEREENLPTIRPQYAATPKINPSLSLNYRKKKINAFLQADNLYTQTLNKNEFVVRTYDDGTVINQQTKRNRNTNFLTTKAGVDWMPNDQNSFTFSGLLGSEKIIDRGDEPFFNEDFSERLRLWQFLEDELKTTIVATATYQHKYKQPGRLLNIGFNYTFHREDEQYFFDNILPTSSGEDAFKLLSDEHVADFNIDYVRPLKFGRLETGLKVRNRRIPTNMQFFPGLNSPLDVGAGGKATYKEIIPAAYGNYVYENKKFEAEIGLRLEYVDLQYEVNPDHNTYSSDGYSYTEPFPSTRFAYKMNEDNQLTVFYNRRVDRPNEVDIRIFPKYDDAEIIKVGNPGLKPQFTSSFELGYKKDWASGYFYSALYNRVVDGTITRLSTIVPGSNLIYAIFQNVAKSNSNGVEIILSQKVNSWFSFNLNLNGYQNQFDAFTVTNLYPEEHVFSAEEQKINSGNIKLNAQFKLSNSLDAQLSSTYLAPDIIPQGRIDARYSVDFGMKKQIQNGKGELFFNANDLFNTLVVKKEILGNNFSYKSQDYNETQVVRIGYSYKF